MLDLHAAAGETLLLYFEGITAPADLATLLRRQPIGGVTLFRHLNSGTPAEIRALTAGLQAAAQTDGRPPLLICADQEGGQLQAIAGTTAFPGNMALGATRDRELACRVGAAIGRELAAIGVNLNYAPVCDVNSNPRNPVIGVRSFGEDPAMVGDLAAAMIAGFQQAGVAATAKHFPGHGDTNQDSHHALSVLPHSRERLDQLELSPFRSAIAAGVQAIMSAHLALPALSGSAEVPATLSPAVLKDLLREALGFSGVAISDAMNMAGLGPLDALAETAVRAIAAGIDLLLLAEPLDYTTALHALVAATRSGSLPAEDLLAAAGRVRALKQHLAAQTQPALAMVGCAEHRTLAGEVAARAVTLVRDDARRLPLRLPSDARILVLMPELADLTPADTSSYEQCELANALRRYHPHIDELIIPADPHPGEIAALCARAAQYDLIIAATINAGDRPGQAALINELLRRDQALISLALRLPYDLETYPGAPTYLCSYSILAPAMDALADALWGRAPINGILPTGIPGLYPTGHGLIRGTR
ncbi:MAG: glycoside hydrolase family 3 protein [Oscillochloris sp.]|nr:glycoside hydrolase family 3 protein [Oscillochloris sp.]